jgi:hypothetical protein
MNTYIYRTSDSKLASRWRGLKISSEGSCDISTSGAVSVGSQYEALRSCWIQRKLRSSCGRSASIILIIGDHCEALYTIRHGILSGQRVSFSGRVFWWWRRDERSIVALPCKVVKRMIPLPKIIPLAHWKSFVDHSGVRTDEGISY